MPVSVPEGPVVVSSSPLGADDAGEGSCGGDNVRPAQHHATPRLCNILCHVGILQPCCDILWHVVARSLLVSIGTLLTAVCRMRE